jgi:hypothetical protein
MRRRSAAADALDMSLVSDLVSCAPDVLVRNLPADVGPQVIPQPRAAFDDSTVPADVLEDLRHISECYRACQAKANVLRTNETTGYALDRDRRDELTRAL